MDKTEFLFDEPSSPEPDIEKEWIGPRHLTASQAKALSRLADLAKLRGQSGLSGVVVRNKPLIVGPSGSGKTALVRRLCDLENLPLLVVNAGSWIVQGASSSTTYTLSMVRRFVESQKEGVIFVDEIDKCCPAGSQTYNHSWSLGVLTEIISLCDSDDKLCTSAWRKEHIQRLRQSFVLVGAGAWQLHATTNRNDTSSSHAGYAEKVVEQAGIPEEVLFRFNSRIVEIGLPTRKDFSQAICRIHAELGLSHLPKSGEEELIDQAIRSNCGMRWIEEYLAELLIQFPRPAAQAPEPIKIISDKVSVSRNEYNQKFNSLLETLDSAQKLAKDMEVKLRLALQIARATPAEKRKDFLDPKQIESLIAAIEEASDGLCYGTSTTRAQWIRYETELHDHGAEVLRLLDVWFKNRAFAMKTCGMLEAALQLYSTLERILRTRNFLAGVEVVE